MRWQSAELERARRQAMNPISKAAALLASLGPAAEEVLKRLQTEQATALRQAMRQLSGTAELAALQQQALLEIQTLLQADGQTAPANISQSGSAAVEVGTTTAVEAAQLRQRLQQAEQTREDAVRLLTEIPPTFLAAALNEEQPRIIAIVVHHLSQEQAAEVLRRLPTDLRRETSLRLAQLQLPPPAVLQSIVQAVLRKVALLAENPELALSNRQAERTAALLRQLERSDRKEVLAALEQSDPALAARVKELLYRVDDLVRLQDRSVQRVLSEVDSRTLALAIKGTSEAVRDKVRKNLSRRAKEALDEEMEFLGGVTQTQVKEAQKQLTDAMQRLDLAGELAFENE